MANLPIPPDVYFSDFAFDLKQYSVIRNNAVVYQYPGLDNEENGKSYVHFQLPCDINTGDLLQCNGTTLLVTKTEFDTFDSKNALLKAFTVKEI